MYVGGKMLTITDSAVKRFKEFAQKRDATGIRIFLMAGG
jgi:Fe-S cluster assembly iron-binding protein IscA